LLPSPRSSDLHLEPQGLKVLWLTSSYPWPGNTYAGIFFQTQAQALSGLGVDMAIQVAVPWTPRIVAWVSARHARRRAEPRHQVDGRIPIDRLLYFGNRFQRCMGRPHLGVARQVLKNLPFRPDLIHGHYAYPMGLAVIEVARRLGIPSVITLHGSDVNTQATESALSSRRFQRTVSGADRVLCVSRALCERTRQLTGISASYLPIGIDLRRFPSPMGRLEARAALDLPPDRPIVLYMGFLDPSKGVRVALEALAQPSLAGVLGLFVGAGPLHSAIATQANCLCREGVPNPLVAHYLAAADMLILPSYAEGLPTVLVEAGACGTPIIATAVGGIPELLGDDRGRMIAPGSSEALKEAILETLAQPATAQRQAERLREYVLDGFDAGRNAGHLLKIYQDLLVQGEPSPT